MRRGAIFLNSAFDRQRRRSHFFVTAKRNVVVRKNNKRYGRLPNLLNYVQNCYYEMSKDKHKVLRYATRGCMFTQTQEDTLSPFVILFMLLLLTVVFGFLFLTGSTARRLQVAAAAKTRKE